MKKVTMKAAVKGLSLALLLSTGIGTLPMYLTVADAASKNGMVLHGKKKILSTKKETSIYVGGKKIDLDLVIRGKNITKNVKWDSTEKDIVSVNKSGKLTAKKNGTAVITAKYKGKKYKTRVRVYTRANSVKVIENGNEISTVELNVGESKNFDLSYGYSDKVTKVAKKPKTTYNSYLFTDGDVVSAVKEKAKARKFTVTALKEGETLVKVFANQTDRENIQNKKNTIAATLRVVVKSKFSAKQVGAKKIHVIGKGLTSTIKDYKVKVDGVERSILEISANEQGTEATLEMSTNFTNDNCTLEFLDKVAGFTTETAKINKVEVLGNCVALNGDSNANGGNIEYRITNQFGENITKKINGIEVTTSVGKAKLGKNLGYIEVTEIPVTFPLNSEVYLTMSNIGPDKKTENFRIGLGKRARASSTVFRGVYNIETGLPYTFKVGDVSDNAKGRIILEVRDQYGRIMRSTEGVNISSNSGKTGLYIMGTEYNTVFSVDGVDCVAVPFMNTAILNEGEDEFVFTALKGDDEQGKNVTVAKIPVIGVKKVEKFTVTPPSEIYANAPAYFGYTATTKSGESITDYEILSNKACGIMLPMAFSWEKEENGKAKLKYDPSKDININNVNWNELKERKRGVMFILFSGKAPGLVEFIVKASPVPNTLQKFAVNGILEGGTTENILSKIEVVDNYGRLMRNLSNTGEYYLGFKKKTVEGGLKIETSGFSETTDGTRYIKLSDLSKGILRFKSEDKQLKYARTYYYSFAIYKGKSENTKIKLSEINVGITVDAANNISDFTVHLPDAVCVNGGRVKVVVKGTAPDGSVVDVKDSDITIHDIKGITDDNTKTLIPSKLKEEAKNEDIKDIITVIVNDGLGTNVKKEITVSSKKPVVKKVKVGREIIDVSEFEKNTAKAILDAIEIEDNYTSAENGVVANPAAKETLKSIKFISSSNPDIKINWDNTPVFKAKGVKKGDTVKVRITFESGAEEDINFELQ